MMQPIPADQVRKTWAQIAVALGAAAVSGSGAWVAEHRLGEQTLAVVYWVAFALHGLAAVWFAARLTVPRDDTGPGTP